MHLSNRSRNYRYPFVLKNNFCNSHILPPPSGLEKVAIKLKCNIQFHVRQIGYYLIYIRNAGRYKNTLTKLIDHWTITEIYTDYTCSTGVLRHHLVITY